MRLLKKILKNTTAPFPLDFGEYPPLQGSPSYEVLAPSPRGLRGVPHLPEGPASASSLPKLACVSGRATIFTVAASPRHPARSGPRVGRQHPRGTPQRRGNALPGPSALSGCSRVRLSDLSSRGTEATCPFFLRCFLASERGRV